MEQSNEPKKATPEQNANVAEQVKRIVIDRIVDEEVEKQLNSPEARLKIEMMAVYRQLSENTTYTKDASKNVLNELSKLTDLVSLYKSRLLENETRLNAIQLRIESLERKEKRR